MRNRVKGQFLKYVTKIKQIYINKKNLLLIVKKYLKIDESANKI